MCVSRRVCVCVKKKSKGSLRCDSLVRKLQVATPPLGSSKFRHLTCWLTPRMVAGVVIPQGMAEYEDSDGEDVGGLPAAVKGMERVKEGYREKQVSCARLSLLDKTRSCVHQ